jgi:hypothetical protein
MTVTSLILQVLKTHIYITTRWSVPHERFYSNYYVLLKHTARYADLFGDEGRERQSRHNNLPSAYKVTRRFKTNSCYLFLSRLACSWLLENRQKYSFVPSSKFETLFIALKIQFGQALKHSKQSIIVPIYKKGDKTDCNNYRGISLLPTTYKILSNILLSRLIPYAEEVIRDHQCGFRRNRSTIDHLFCIRQILEKKWEYNESVHQLFIDFTKAYDSVRREVLYNILIEFWIPKKLVRLIKMCLKRIAESG